jgi:[ribosomal protein S5]-alanine N-acetyltransferase
MTNKNFTPFPILNTERLTLRQLTLDDQQAIFALRSDAEINKYLDRAPCNTIEDAINFINKVNENIKNNNSLYWAISLSSTQTFVGTICIFDFLNDQNSCEIGYELKTTFQKQGIMNEAIKVIIDYAFNTLQFQKIVAFTHKHNQHSTRLLTKLSFIASKEIVEENDEIIIFELNRE